MPQYFGSYQSGTPFGSAGSGFSPPGMPPPPAGGGFNWQSLIAPALGLLSQGINAAVQSGTNRNSQQWNEHMYSIQRQDALADWAMNNAYNHPSAQMQRFKEAGLNPNLIYGRGNEGNAAPVRSSSSGQWSPRAPQFDLGSVLMSYYDTQLKDAQIDNLRTDNTIKIEEAMNKAMYRKVMEANIGKTMSETDFIKWKQEFEEEVRPYSLEIRHWKYRKDMQSVLFSLNEDERQDLMNTQKIAESMERVVLMQAQREKISVDIDKVRAMISNLEKDGTLKDLQNQMQRWEVGLSKQGITKQDNFGLRQLVLLRDNIIKASSR